MNDLRDKVIRGGFARVCSQGANLALRIGSLMALARLLQPKDFGLVGMVTAFTGVLSLFRDFGLSAASVQRGSVTEDQMSTLFWINVLAGAILTVLAWVLAPFISAFYHEPRLVWVTSVVASGFVFNAIGIQHSALLQRQMRFTALSVIDVTAWTLSTVLAIVMAKAGFGYWALVAMTVALPLASTIGLWLTTRWVPGMPKRRSGISSLMRFGSTLTLNGLVVYLASNFEKILLGRFWGAEAIGIYGRAYQLIRIPTDTLNNAVGEVAFSALSRLQDDPPRFRSYFLKGYSLVLALTLPATISCVLFGDDIISVFLGPKWKQAAIIFQFLAPTVLVFAVANPLSWLVSSLGWVARGLKMSLVIAPLMIVGYLIGLPYGPKGVAFAYSTVMLLWVLPVIAWSVHGTPISLRDIIATFSRPLLGCAVAGALAVGMRVICGQWFSPLSRLVMESFVLFAVYIGILFYVLGQKPFYMGILGKLLGSASVQEKVLASA
jgi:PST family polysaccharide transporter